MNNHEPIVPQCIGCGRIFKEVVGDKREVCGRHPFPHIRWLGGFDCEDATFLKKDNDYNDDSHYDNRKSSR